MSARLHVDPADMRTLETHLAAGADEQLAFLLATWDGDDAYAFELRLIGGEALDVQSPWHIALADEERATVIKWAHDRGGALVEAHVHRGGDPAGFSPTDLRGLAQFVPHVWWRLQHRPYVALVFGEESFDALVWRTGPAAPEPLHAVIVDGATPRKPTGLTLRGRIR